MCWSKTNRADIIYFMDIYKGSSANADTEHTLECNIIKG